MGLSQRAVAAAAHMSRPAYGRIERAELVTVGILVAARIAAILGLDLFVALYPGPRGLRDEASARLIKRVIAEIGGPLTYRTEVTLPKRTDVPEQRSWDLMTFGLGERTGFEFETRLYDAQAQIRRHNLKRRDDPPNHFLMVVADTRHNREVVRTYIDLFAELPRLRTANVLKMLRAGQHPPTGLILL